MVSQVPPSLMSSSLLRPLLPTLMPLRSSFLIRRRILPPGVWIANLAGFLPATVPLAELGFDPDPLVEAFMLMADAGRANGIGLVAPGLDDGVKAD